ncbi:MAG: hypothetical protein ACPGJV_11545 [Bacteriovoracaceae bacterium]
MVVLKSTSLYPYRMLKTGLADKINLDDFKTLKHYMVMKNETSSTPFLDANAFEFQGIADNMFYFLSPKNTCNHGHHLQVALLPKKPKRPFAHFPNEQGNQTAIFLVGKVTEIDNLSAEKMIIHLKIGQVNMNDISDVSKVYENRQAAINDLIDRGK